MKNDFTKPVLKVGQVWRDGCGKIVRIIHQHDHSSFPFIGDNDFSYTLYGNFNYMVRSKADLIELIEDVTDKETLTPENYKRIDHEDGRIEFVPIEKKEKDVYFNFNSKHEINLSILDNPPLAIAKWCAEQEFEYKELLVHPDYNLEVVEKNDYTRLRFKKNKT